MIVRVSVREQMGLSWQRALGVSYRDIGRRFGIDEDAAETLLKRGWVEVEARDGSR